MTPLPHHPPSFFAKRIPAHSLRYWPTFLCLGRDLAQRGLVLGLILLLPLYWSGCGFRPSAPTSTVHPVDLSKLSVTMTPDQEARLNIQTGQTREASLATEIECAGEIETAEYLTADIYPPANGRMVDIKAVVGQVVQPGDLLATIRSDEVGMLQSDLIQEVIADDVEIRQARIELERAQAAYEREQALYVEEVSAKADLEAAMAAYLKERENLRSLQQKKKARIAALKERLSLFGVNSTTVNDIVKTRTIKPLMTITSPRYGVVVARHANEGELVDSSKVIFSIADLKKVWLEGDVTEKDVRRVQLNNPITVSLDSYPDQKYQGHLSFVGSLLDPMTRTLKVVGEVDNPKGLLKPHMFARMRVQVGRHQGLLVPKSAVTRVGDFDFVFVSPRPHHYLQQAVKTGQNNDEMVEILEGLQPNQEVVTHGAVHLKGLFLLAFEKAQQTGKTSIESTSPPSQGGHSH